MAFFSPEEIQLYEENRASLEERAHKVAESYLTIKYKSAHGLEFAKHGYLRRLFTMARCVQRVFELVPLGQEGLPEERNLDDATVYIQAFVMNVFGALDDLAWIWASEKPLNLERLKVGLTPKNKEIWNSLSQEMKGYLSSLRQWFDHIVDFRDALAHRIPLYIPPYCVPDVNIEAYLKLDEMKWADVQNINEYERIKAEQLKLVVFRPVMKHSLSDETSPVVFHPQLLQDFVTVEDIGQRMLVELNALSEER